ncbi:MAG: hypothetical protein WBF06_06645 [Candidatus Acidiferrales bacterium]
MLTAAMFLATTLFRPPAFLVLSLFQALALALDNLRHRIPAKETLWIVPRGIVCVLLLSREQSAAHGPTLTLSEMLRMPNFYAGGVFYTQKSYSHTSFAT